MRGCYPTIAMLLPFLVHKFNPFFIIIIIINSGFVPVVHNPISSATPISVFCLLRSFSPPVLFTPFSLCQHPIILRYTYLPTCLPHRYPIPGSLLSLPLSAPASQPPPTDGIIPVILSHYRSSDANGCTANPAAGSLD